MKKLVLFTFDYELFLGNRSGTVQECIITPTYKLLSLLNQYQFKGVFFVDTTYLLSLKTVAELYLKAKEDQAAIYEQLRNLIQQGHYVFPHVHAHWLDAEYLPDENEWSLKELRYYQFSALDQERQTKLFGESVQLIQSIADSVVKNYQIDSYRAGGWSIQPFLSFKPHFLKHGIHHEWSVLPGKYVTSTAHSFDFRKVPTEQPTYHFNDDVCKSEKNGSFKEWTISTLSLSRFEKWMNFKVNGLIQRLIKKEKPKGSTVSSKIKEEGDIYCERNGLRLIASFEGLNPYNLIKYLARIKRATYFHFISHPKLITGTEFRMMNILFRSLSKQKDLETDFRKVNF